MSLKAVQISDHHREYEPAEHDRKISKDDEHPPKPRLKRVPSACAIQLDALTKPTDIDDVLFDFLSENGSTMSVNKFWNIVTCTGTVLDHKRLHIHVF